MKLAAAVAMILAPAWSSGVPAPGLPGAQSTPVTLSPTHDTYVNAALPDTSYGNSVYLSVENNSSTMERSYLEFDTSSLSGQTVTSAILTVWVIRDNSGGGVTDIFELYPIYTAWTDSLTYNQSATLTKGAMVTSVASTDYPSGNPSAPNDTVPPQAVTFDITTLVQSWASGGTNEGLVIQFPTSANADFRFASIDNPDPTIRPILTVTASSPSTPPPTPPPSTPPPSAAPAGGGSEGDEGLCGALGAEALILAGILGFTRRRRLP
jgi:hypothetical protein